MNMRAFVVVAVLIVPVMLFGVSCKKETPATNELALEASVQSSMGEQPFFAEAMHDEEGVQYESEEQEGEDEDVGYESEEDEGEDEDMGHESEEDEGEDEESTYGSDTDEHA